MGVFWEHRLRGYCSLASLASGTNRSTQSYGALLVSGTNVRVCYGAETLTTWHFHPHLACVLYVFVAIAVSECFIVFKLDCPSDRQSDMATSKRTVLITGCSDGGMGSELAKEFHKAGLLVVATARDVKKMSELIPLGIETMPLDVQSEASIAACVEKVKQLDILINNAGASYTMPIADVAISEAKKLFDTNVWGCIAMTQAFLPVLMKSSQAVIVNHTSVGAGLALPFQATYNASKAAMSMYSDTLRMELQPFGISVVNLKTGGVQTNIVKNVQAKNPELPPNSIYQPAKEVVEKALRGEWVEARGLGIPAQRWAREVVADLLKKNPPPVILRGESATLASLVSCFPSAWFDGTSKRMTGLEEAEKIIRKQ